MRISVVVNTKNEEKYIEQCLHSVSWADEIIVVDMHSSDATVSLAMKYTNLVYECEDFGYVEPARNQAISRATGDWILILDADEVIPSNLSVSIHEIVAKYERAALIAIPRRNYIGDYWIKNSGWGLDYQPRLLKQGKVTWKDTIHSWPDVDGEIVHVEHTEDFYIQHYNYVDLSDFVERLNRYTDIEADNFDLTKLDADWTNIFQLVLDEFDFRYTPKEDGAYSLFLAGCMAFYRFIACCKALEKDDLKHRLLVPGSTNEILSRLAYKNIESILESRLQKTQVNLENLIECQIKKSQSQLESLLVAEFQKYQSDLETLLDSEFQKSQSKLETLLESELRNSQSEVDALKQQLYQTQSELSKSESQLQQVQRYFEDAVNEIRSMETSKFWKMRTTWFKFKRLGFLSHQTLTTEGISPLIAKVKQKIDRKLRPYKHSKNNNYLSAIDLNLEPAESVHLETSSEPLVSMIVPVFNQSSYTFNCLKSLTSIESIAYEVIVIDDSSTDDTQAVLSNVSGIQVITNSNNLGFIRSCNRGAAAAKGKFICFLNNDTKVLPDWLKSLLEVIDLDPTVGAVGSKLIYPDGRLQEAGGIIWQDASGCNFGRLDNPYKPEYNYVREVDYCSGASLLVRRELFDRIGGFSEEFLPAYYEDTDLCFTIRSLGYKVMYQPQSQIVHYEGISSGTDINSGVKQHQKTNAIKFEIKWRDTLKKYHLPAGTENREGSRRHAPKPTILIVDSYVPIYDKESGSCRLFNIIKIFRKLGYSIVFLPDNGQHQEPYVSELQSLGVEVLYSTDEMPAMPPQLLERLSAIDIAWVCRPELCDKYLEVIKQNPKIQIIYDTIDLHFLRTKREKELLGDSIYQPISWQSYQQQEIGIARSVRSTVVVTEMEKDILLSLGIPNVCAIPNIHEGYTGILPEFSSREGLLFIGGYNHTPNVDAVVWLCNEIMPLVWQQDPAIELTLLGSNPPAIVKSLQNDRVTVTGYIRDIEPYFLSHRVFVAPLRYGAGLKGKVGQSLSYGLPVVTTSIGAEGFGLVNRQDAAIVDDRESFANFILTLYRDPVLWQSISLAGLEKIKQFQPEAIEHILKDLIDTLSKSNVE